MIDRGPVTAAVRDLLVRFTGRPCGLGELPLVEGVPAELPYTVLYPLGGSAAGALLMDAWQDTTLVYQVTVVAGRTDQAEWLADRVRRAVLERTETGGWAYGLAVPGAEVWARELLVDEGFAGESSKDGLVSGAQRFGLAVT
ncbi:hypothetical protein AB0G73_19070 [Streptomyces sp. NPDC020719]|uniref:hypothetical protein n=1 Tax=Streptomyces sp. NPDC020719 TaxID=3154896 RepID=UPI0033EABCA3